MKKQRIDFYLRLIRAVAGAPTRWVTWIKTPPLQCVHVVRKQLEKPAQIDDVAESSQDQLA